MLFHEKTYQIVISTRIHPVDLCFLVQHFTITYLLTLVNPREGA